MSLTDDQRRAADPATPLTQLQELAQNVPETRAFVAANPATYPALLDWLAEFDDPAIQAALKERALREDGASDIPQTHEDDTWDDQASSPVDDQDVRWEPLIPSADHSATLTPPPRERGTSQRVGTIIAAVVLVLAIVLGGGLYYAHTHPTSSLGRLVGDLFGEATSSNAGPQRTASPADTDNPAAAERPGTDEAQKALALTQQERLVKDFPTEDPSAAVRPVPPAAYTDVPRFQVDGGQVVCDLTGAQVSCVIKRTSENYGNNGGPLRLSVASGGVFQLSEPQNDVRRLGADYPVLADAAAVTLGGLACVSHGSTVECWDSQTGHGFTVGGGRVGQF